MTRFFSRKAARSLPRRGRRLSPPRSGGPGIPRRCLAVQKPVGKKIMRLIRHIKTPRPSDAKIGMTPNCPAHTAQAQLRVIPQNPYYLTSMVTSLSLDSLYTFRSAAQNACPRSSLAPVSAAGPCTSGAGIGCFPSPGARCPMRMD